MSTHHDQRGITSLDDPEPYAEPAECRAGCDDAVNHALRWLQVLATVIVLLTLAGSVVDAFTGHGGENLVTLGWSAVALLWIAIALLWMHKARQLGDRS